MESLALDSVLSFDCSLTLIVRGIVDDDTVEQFERLLDLAIGNRSPQLIIDLTGCHLSSAGLAALIRLQRRSSVVAAATGLVVTDVEQLRMLQIVGLTSRFRVFGALTSALCSCRRPVRTVSAKAERRPSHGVKIRHLSSVGGLGAGDFARQVERGSRAVASATATGQ